MTDIIQELRGLIAKATPGPWECDGAVLEYEGARFGEVAYVIGKAGQQFPAKAANAALIVAAINHLPALLDRLEAAERVANAARDYASNYLLDEREDPTICFESIQHERIIELFDALDAPAIREER